MLKAKLPFQVRALELELLYLIDETLNSFSKSASYRSQTASTPITPIAFENQCAEILELHGWQASTTKASGDQGADVIAIKNGKKIVLQCKLYKGAVGNAAVQQAFSAMTHYGADYSGVVSESVYTNSAIELAATTKTLLLDLDSLPLLEKRLN